VFYEVEVQTVWRAGAGSRTGCTREAYGKPGGAPVTARPPGALAAAKGVREKAPHLRFLFDAPVSLGYIAGAGGDASRVKEKPPLNAREYTGEEPLLWCFPHAPGAYTETAFGADL